MKHIQKHDILYNANVLILNSENKELRFKYEIGQVVLFTSCIVIRLEPPKGIIFNENIIAVSYDGVAIWRVEKIDHMDKDSPFTSIEKSGEKLFAYNWDSCDYHIDLLTGKIIDREFVK